MSTTGPDDRSERLSVEEAGDLVDRLARRPRRRLPAAPARRGGGALLHPDAREEAELLLALPPAERRSWMRLPAPDDTADLIQAAPQPKRAELLALLDVPTRKEVSGLLAYRGGRRRQARADGRRYARLRPEDGGRRGRLLLSCDSQARAAVETIYYAYVLTIPTSACSAWSPSASVFGGARAAGARGRGDGRGRRLRRQDQVVRVPACSPKHALSSMPVVDFQRAI